MRDEIMIRHLIAGAILFAVVPVFAQEAKPDVPMAAKVTYDDHVKPIFREHCLSCHNQEQKKGGLALDTYGAAMSGGSSGEVILAGDKDSSRLYSLVTHAETPKMPPMQDKLAAAKLDVLSKWIDGSLRAPGRRRASGTPPVRRRGRAARRSRRRA